MTFPREVLNEIKWRFNNKQLKDVLIYYRCRGSASNVGVRHGEDIISMDTFGLNFSDGTVIPYYKILKIEFNGRCMFDLEVERKQ